MALPQPMDNLRETRPNPAKVVNIAALRIYRLLSWLLTHDGLTLAEINARFLVDSDTRRTFSDDTVGLYLNTLRELGCVIRRPTKTNGGRYRLVAHPFAPLADSTYKNALMEWKRALMDQLPTETLLAVDSVLARLLDVGFDKEVSPPVESPAQQWFRQCRAVDYSSYQTVLATLRHAMSGDALVFLYYQSPRQGSEHLYFRPRELVYQAGALYVQGYRLGAALGEVSRLRVDRIVHCQAVNHPQVQAVLAAEKKSALPVAGVVLSSLASDGDMTMSAHAAAAWLKAALGSHGTIQPWPALTGTSVAAVWPKQLELGQARAYTSAREVDESLVWVFFPLEDPFEAMQVLLQCPVPVHVLGPDSLYNAFSQELAAMSDHYAQDIEVPALSVDTPVMAV